MTAVPILQAMAAAGKKYAALAPLSFVNETAYTETTQNATGTVTPANTPGNLLAICCAWRPTSATIVNVGSPGSNVDPGGNTWTLVQNQGGIAIWATITTAVAGLVTVTLNGAGTTKAISCIEVAGVSSVTKDVVAFGQAANNSPTVTSAATTKANDVVLAWVAQQIATATFSAHSAGFTPLTTHASAEAVRPVQIQGAYKIVAATGAQTYSLSSTSSAQWMDHLAAFKGA